MPLARATRRAAFLLVLPIAVTRLGAQAAEHAGHHGDPPVRVESLGRIDFPTSAAPRAHAEFVRGVLYLHNFHYPQAIAAFRRARALDSADVMSAAFEAFAFTHPVWNQQDTAGARAALRALAPTREARLAMARTPRERDWLDAVEALYHGDTPKAVRDSAFSRGMHELHAADPRDAEAAAFYALSLLGLNQGVREAGAYARAEAVSDTVLAARPRHPGALHYKIHAVDAPATAARGVRAARAYGEVASSAGHALHMTSHIYMALGDWGDVVAANRRAQALNPHVFGHGTHWLAYGLVQQGRVREARAWVDSMLLYQREIATGKLTTVRGVGDAAGYAVSIPASWLVDAAAWDSPLAREHADSANVEEHSLRALADFAPGYAAARRAGRPVDGPASSRAADRAYADSMLRRMEARRLASPDSSVYGRQSLAQAEVMEKILRAELVAGSGRRDAAVAMLRDAATQLESLPFDFGPPVVVKPPRERAAELLYAANRPAEALAELDLADRMAPGRSLARLLRARALDMLGRRAEARKVYAALARDWRTADRDFPELAEARWGSGMMPELGAKASVAAARAARADTITYASGDLALRGVLWRPGAAGRHPALVVLHGSGGCWRASQTDVLGRTFAAHGYVAFFPCRRGQGLSAGQGEAIMVQVQRETKERGATQPEMGPRTVELLSTTQLADVRAAIASVRARPDVDAGRVAVTGTSFGGIMTLLAAEDDSTLSAAVSFAPGAMNWEWNAPVRERLLDAARRARVPLLVLQADNDWSTGPVREIPDAARASGGKAEGKLYPSFGNDAGTGHALMAHGPQLWRDDVLAFLDRHLKLAVPRRVARAK